MTEPVAWRTKDKSRLFGWRYSTTKLTDKYAESLYTAKQLHQRVKMDKEVFRQFDNAYGKYEFLHDLYTEHNHEFQELLNFAKTSPESEKQVLWAWINYDINRPEETIEIVPDMKWFVRSKELQNNGKYTYLEVGNYKTPDYDQLKLKFATQFNTEDEAELWTNPLTEAVQLPVEDE